MTEIAFITRTLAHYRVPFHEAVKAKLAMSGVRYRLLYGQPRHREASKGDSATIDWAEPVKNLYLGPRGRFVWQPVLRRVANADLVVIGQENSLLTNYVLQLWRTFGGPKLAFFGHGKNFQTPSPMGPAERFKRLWIRHVDWWFAYTQRSADIVAGAGFPRDRITVFNNAIDTTSVAEEIRSLDPLEQSQLREKMFGGSHNVGVYVGGLYAEKRLGFLLDAARLIRAELPDFHLLIIGGGPDAGMVEAAAHGDPWLRYVGPKFGREKTALATLAKVFLMPGLVGLSVLDSFAYGTPMLTTDTSLHSPEIDYLRDSENGIVVNGHTGPAGYARAALAVLRDDTYLARLRRNGQSALATLNVDAMAQRFSDGTSLALGRLASQSARPRRRETAR